MVESLLDSDQKDLWLLASHFAMAFPGRSGGVPLHGGDIDFLECPPGISHG